MAYKSERLKRGLPMRDIMVSGDKTLLGLSKMLSGHYYTRFHITGDDYRVIKIITETELEEKMLERNVAEKVKTVDF